MTHHRRVLSAVLCAVLGLGALAVLGATPAHAVTGVFLSEIHYDNEGTDTGEFVEVTAPAGTDLAGYSVVLYNGNGGGTYETDDLSGVVGDQQDGWGTFVVGYPANGIQNGDPDGVALVRGSTVVEFWSYEGTFQATNGPASGQTPVSMGVSESSTTPVGHSLQRQVDGTWTGPAANTRGVPNGYTVEGLPLAAETPADVTGYVGIRFDDIVLAASGGEAPYTWVVTGLPAGLSESEDGVIGGRPTTTGTSEVTATVSDAAGATDTVTFTITIVEPEAKSIAEIQGTGNVSPLAGEVVRTQGVVTATYPTGGINGFYIQTPGEDTTPGTSDGLFVFGPGFDEATLDIGDSVEVAGQVAEFGTLTEIIGERVTELGTSLGEVVPNDTIPGTDCQLGSTCPSLEELASAKEEFEGELFWPTDPYTVTDSYDFSAFNPPNGGSSNFFGEIGLAGGSEVPLITPTEVEDAQTGDVAGRVAYNNAHRVVLDDGSTTTYWNTSNTGQTDRPFPWLTQDHTVRVGAAVTFEAPVVLDYRFGWKVQPQHPVVGTQTHGVAIEQDRAENALPADVAGDVKLATFNVLNYFPTTAVEWEASGAGDCSAFVDRQGNPVAANRCGTDADPGPRGAWDTENFERQEAKIVDAIVELGADVVSLEEIENSVKFGKDRDFAVETLVAALNEVEGAGTWDHAPSPDASELPSVAEQDVIRTAFIYKPASVALVGESRVLTTGPEFADSREPFGQAFKAVHESDDRAFLVIANHFKSKRSGTPDPVQGNGNAERVQQAEALVAFADDFAADLGVTRVYLTGDFNAYSEEDPVQVIEAAGYTSLESTDDPAEETYSFDGAVGSLDHVFVNEVAAEEVTGVDVWEINANESVFYEYGRYNYNVTDLYGVHPFRSSDHNPELVGIDVREPSAVSVDVDPDGRIKPGKRVKVFATVTSPDGLPVSGTVTFTSERVTQEVEVVDGRATGRFSWVTLGEHTVTVTYGGNDRLAPATTDARVTVVGK